MGSVQIVKASAGSGKTYRLAYEYVRNVVTDPARYRHILAVTFTNKATEEMKRRIIGEINALANGAESPYLSALKSDTKLSEELIQERAHEARTKILHDYSHFTILTIDKFFQRIIRSFIRELGLEMNYSLELQTDSLLEEAADRLIEEIALNRQLHKWMLSFVEEKIDQGGGWDIRKEISELGKELFTERYRSHSSARLSKEELARIVQEASARSREIKQKMRNMGLKALKVINEQGVSTDDFAGKSKSFTQYFVKMSEGKIVPYTKSAAEAAESLEKWVPKNSPKSTQLHEAATLLQPLLRELCNLYDQHIRFFNTTDLLQQNFRSFALLADLSQKVASICAEQNLMPIAETNDLLAKLIGKNETPFIYEKVGNAFSHFMIDEFQDTSHEQWQNFIPLLHNALAQSNQAPVLLVGDVKQSIYRWRGGDWRILGQEAPREFSQKQEHLLESNYRSEGVVVAFNNELIDRIVRADNGALNDWLTRAHEEGMIPPSCRSELTDVLQNAYDQHRQHPQRGLGSGYVRITLLSDAKKNAAPRAAPEKGAESPLPRSAMIALVEELQERGYAPNEIAILVRYKKEGVALATELLDYKATHPHSPWCYDLVTQEALTIGNAPVVGFILAIFRLSVDPKDSIARALYNQYQNLPFDTAISENRLRFIHSLRLHSLEEALELLLLEYRLNKRQEEIAYIQALQEQIHQFGATKVADIPLFLKWWEELGKEQSISLPDKSQALTIITIHKAKGLEYKVVILPYCDWSMAPRSGSLIWAGSSDQALATLGKVPMRWEKKIGSSDFSASYFQESVLTHIDNINTLYVATTRAREELHMLMKSPSAPKEISTQINQLIYQSLPIIKERERFIWGGIEGNFEASEGVKCYSFGTPFTHEKAERMPSIVMKYPIRKDKTPLRFGLNSQRYFPEGEQMQLSARDQGKLMHKVFEQIESLSQIESQMALWRSEGALSEPEVEQLRKTIDVAFQNPVIRGWFETPWEEVRNETDIIVPQGEVPRRPDRVMTRGREAVIVDYKFGGLKHPSHSAQIREYATLLSRMGYQKIQGYLWYVTLQKVELVNLT